MTRWSLFALMALAVGCGASRPYGRAVAVTAAPSRNVEIAGGQQGFEPKRLEVATGEVVELVVTRTGKRECMEAIEIWLDDEKTVVHELDVGESATMTLPFDAPGVLGIATVDRHFGASIEVRGAGDDR